jgi:hypothetical protein
VTARDLGLRVAFEVNDRHIAISVFHFGSVLSPVLSAATSIVPGETRA